jgi:transposase-like protein
MIRKPPRSPRFYTPEQWKEFIDKWQKSGLSQSKFCRQHELTHSAFFRWRNKITGLKSGLSIPKTSQTASFDSLSRVTEKSELVHKKKRRKACYYTAAQWKEFIHDWKQSGFSQRNYCRQKGLTYSAFVNWSKKLEDPEVAKLANIKKRTQYTFEQWKEFIDDWKKSGLSQGAYCLQKNLAPTTFFSWSKKLENQELAKTESLQGCTHYDPNQWKGFVEEWKKSDLSIARYCAKNGLNPGSFYKWKQKFKSAKLSLQVEEHPEKQKPSPSFSFEENFIPVMLKPPSLTNASNVNPRIEVTLSQGHHLSIQGPFDWGNLIALLTSILRS